MERELWRIVTAALKRLPRRRGRGQLYSSADILAVLLWAALHERSILWACQRRHWPVQAWRRALPDQSTMSRRLRDPRVLDDLKALMHMLQDACLSSDDGMVRVDGKPLAVSWFSQDHDARAGWGAGQQQRGYKLHAMTRSALRLIDFEVEPMNVPESIVAETLLRNASARGRLPRDGIALADASYDTNPLHAAAHECGVQLLAPRRRPGTGISTKHVQHPGRVLSVTLLEGDEAIAKWQRAERACIEHFFANLTNRVRLNHLPPWVRTLRRVRLWVAAKVTLHAAAVAHAARAKQQSVA